MSLEYQYYGEIVPEFVRLTGELDRELWSKNGESQQFYHGFNKLEGIRDVVLALENGQAVGCASFKRKESGSAEVKRVFVQPDRRGRGISKGLMAELERQAASRGIDSLVLETSRDFAEAVGLYTSLGYRVVPNFPPYEEMEKSICFKKELSL